MVDAVVALERAYDQTAKLVADMGAEQLDAPSPCAGWDVRATLNHLLGATWMFSLVNEGHDGGVGGAAADAIGDDARLAVAAAAARNLASWRQPDALEGDRTYPFGTFPAPFGLMLNLQEVVVHNWDIATATGAELAVDDDIARCVYAWAVAIPLDEFRSHGAFGPEVSVDAGASTLDRLIGLFGRQPRDAARHGGCAEPRHA